MSTLLVRRTLATLALTAVLAGAGAGPARAVQVSAGTAWGLAGQVVDIPLTITSTTGLGIRSLQFDLTYNADLVTATDVLEAGTLVGTAGWGEATFGVTSSGGTGRLRVGHAGTTALSGSGVLLQVRFLVNPAQLAASYTGLGLSNLLFNEGTPAGTTIDWSITINATPILAVSPDAGEIVRGQTLQFTVSGSVTNPVSWSTTDAGVATILSTGLLTGVAPGQVKVFAADAAARRDTTGGVVQVRGMGLTAGNAAVYPGNAVSVPITVTDLAGLGIRAGQFALAFDGSLLTATGVSTPAGTLLNGYGPVGFGVSRGACTVDFAGATDLAGSGVLCHVQFLAGVNTGWTALAVTRALFNETLPAKPTDGSITVSGLPAIAVSPDV